MSAETDILIRYGFVPPDQTDLLQGPLEECELSLKLFGKDEDSGWSTGAGIRKASNIGLSARSKAALGYIDDMREEIASARREGKTPFRIAGHPDYFPEFLEQIRLVEIEFVV